MKTQPFTDLPDCVLPQQYFGDDYLRLPIVHRILLENILRCADEDDREDGLASFRQWLANGTADAEIRFQPSRLLMHDTTSGPALVDIAAMRDVVAAAGVDPSALNPRLPVATSVDHSIAVDEFGHAGVLAANMHKEAARNLERYRFLRWASQTVSDFRVFPPGAGIMHTINMERLSVVAACSRSADGRMLCHPDTVIGTDSHTPMVNGMGVLGWGVGGVEAEGLMFGGPISLRLPDVIGVRLTGVLSAGVIATDLALRITERLRRARVSGEFLEFFGPALPGLSVGQRAVVANMAPEYGATTGFFPVDDRVLDYLRQTGRTTKQIALVEHQARRQLLWRDDSRQPTYTRVIDIDIGEVRPTVSGPRRPQDALSPQQVPSAIADVAAGAKPGPLPADALAIAAITSCTNTTDISLLVMAGLVARNAVARGLKVPHWVKTSLTPGSPATRMRLERVGLLDPLEQLGFAIAGFGCATCIGNSGPLTSVYEQAMRDQGIRAVAVLSGNRNFPGRVHTSVEHAFLASPPLVVAWSLSGRAAIDVLHDALGSDSQGKDVHLRELWPTDGEVEELTRRAIRQDDVETAYDAAERSAFWTALDGPSTPLFPWDSRSTYLRPPPFVALAEPAVTGKLSMYPLIVLGDDITTDHISPAGAIPPASAAGRWLIENGEDSKDLNVYASRRGNWEVILRGLFTNRDVRNLLQTEIRAGFSVYPGAPEPDLIWKVAERHKQAGHALVIVAGHRYGTGSSRDWAAKGLALLGVRVLLAKSIERIHRSNLVGMGVLPVRMPEDWSPSDLTLSPDDRVEIDWQPDEWAPRQDIPITIHRTNRESKTGIGCLLVETQLEIELLRSGGMISRILHETIAAGRDAARICHKGF